MRVAIVLVALSAAGCKTAHYTAASLPDPLRVAPATASKGINLSRMGGGGIGTSQIAPGDLVEITIVSGTADEEAKPTPARVSHDGLVMVPLIGPVGVVGLEPFAAEQQIAAAAVARGIYRQPYVTLRVTEQAVNRVTVMGAVASPGVVELPRGSSDVLSALAAAGGLNEDASTQVDVLRQGGVSYMAGESPGQPGGAADTGVRLASYTAADGTSPKLPGLFSPPTDAPGSALAAGDPATWSAPAAYATRIDLAQADRPAGEHFRLGDRDVVMVLPKEKRVIHVTGLVHKPDQFEIPGDKDVRLLDAIAMAGGLKSPLADKVFVIRQFPDMPEPAVIRVSIASAKRNGDENLRLAPGDLVSVEATVATMVLDTATNFFRVAIGLSGSVMTF